jgi:hypothetical protein
MMIYPAIPFSIKRHLLFAHSKDSIPLFSHAIQRSRRYVLQVFLLSSTSMWIQSSLCTSTIMSQTESQRGPYSISPIVIPSPITSGNDTSELSTKLIHKIPMALVPPTHFLDSQPFPHPYCTRPPPWPRQYPPLHFPRPQRLGPHDPRTCFYSTLA